MRNSLNKFNERSEKQIQSKNQKINKIKLPFINKKDNKFQIKNNLRNPQSANLSNKILNNAIEIGKKIYNRDIITPNLVNIYPIPILEKENKDYIINNNISKSSPKNRNLKNINNNFNNDTKNKLCSSFNNRQNIIGAEKYKISNELNAKELLCFLNNLNNINKYLNLNNQKNIFNNNNNNTYKNIDKNIKPNQLNFYSKNNNINQSSNLIKNIEISYLLNEKNKNQFLNNFNLFQSMNRKEISKENSNNDNNNNLIINKNKRISKKRKYNSQIKIYDKNIYFIDNNLNKNNSKNSINSNNISKVKNNKESLCFISYSYNEYPNIPYRKSMEDYHCIKQNLLKNNSFIYSYFAIFDGHSGNEVALYLSKHLHKILSKLLFNLNESINNNLNNIINTNINKNDNNSQNNHNNKIISLMKKSFEIADEEILNNLTYTKDVGSTGTIILLYKLKNENNNIFSRYLICANIGDSKGYLLTKNNFTQITKEHKCNDIKEVERIKKNGGIVFNNRVFGTLMLTRSFGDKEMKKYGVISTPDCFCHKIKDEDLYIVIASDGVWDAVSEEEIMQMGGDKFSSDDFSKKIVKLAVDKGTRDNISCIVIKLNKDI